MKTPFSLVARIKSFKFAFKGIWFLLSTQHNAWIHILATIAVTILAFVFHISTTEWCLLILTIALVLTAEAFNTAIEFLADSVTTDFNPLIGKAKDVAAGAVLITAIGAIIIGCFIFIPYLKGFLFHWRGN